MFGVDNYAAVRRFVFVEGHSRREAARVFGLSRETVLKMCRFSLPPGYTRPVIDTILDTDRTGPVKQRHTAKRIFERLRDEHDFTGGYTVVKDYVRICRARGRETFVPLAHPPGHGQVDFGEAVAVIGGVRQKIHFFCMDLPQSDACFVKAYPRETTEAFLDGHVSAFAFFGGVPLSLLYDNTTIAVAKICGDGKRERTRAFTELVSHYLFADRFGRPGKGNDKGNVEGLVKHARLNFMVPIPEAASFDELNARLEAQCRQRQAERAGRHAETIGERLVADTAALRALPAVPLEPCEKRSGRVSSTALVRYRCNDYSVPTRYGFQEVMVKGFVDEVVILCAGKVIARHPRSYAEGAFIADPLHYPVLFMSLPAKVLPTRFEVWRLRRSAVFGCAGNGAISGVWRFAGTELDRRHGRISYGLASRKLRATWRNSAASGQALANAMRIRVAVSTTRAATLISRRRMVANSAVLSAAVGGSAWRTLHISQ
jgi:transposase